MKIQDLFNIQQRFMRSAQLERDFADPTALSGYVVTNQIRDSLVRINVGLGRGSSQRAWRITGDYGSGKSSFALLLARLYARKEGQLPTQVRQSLDAPIQQLKASRVRFHPVLVTGSREALGVSIVRGIAQSFEKAEGDTRRLRPYVLDQTRFLLQKPQILRDQQVVDLVTEIHCRLANKTEAQGLLIILDELGKLLEFAALHPTRQDVFLLQQLSEAAARSRGDRPLFVLGLLHQGFSAYADMLSQSAQREWEKIAGRFEELLFNQPLEQVSHLVSAALNISTNRLPRGVEVRATKGMSDTASLGWYGASAPLGSLRSTAAGIYPLHPTVLPVLVRFLSRWGQNERSLFSFLLSNEPFALLPFSALEPSPERFYCVHDLFDYVAANFSHRLGTQSYRSHWNHIESLIRSFHTQNEAELAVLKTVGLLNLINSPDLAPTEDAIILAVANQPSLRAAEVRQAIHRLHHDRHVLYLRGRAGGYCLWSHVSINLDAAYEEAGRASLKGQKVAARIVEHLDSRPIVARRHYIQTGNLRMFSVTYCDVKELAEEIAKPMQETADGRIIIPLCETAEDAETALVTAKSITGHSETLIGLTEPLASLDGLVQELERWTWVQRNTPELKDDKYAAEEVTRQLALARQTLEKQIEHYVGLRVASRRSHMPLKWYHEGHPCTIRTGTALQSHLSQLCDQIYDQAPLVRNELVNRASVSAAATLARTRLIERMFNKTNEPLLGMDPTKKPPEMAIYMSILKAGGIHVNRQSQWLLVTPSSSGDTCLIGPSLKRIADLLKAAGDQRVSIPTLFKELRRRPYGIKAGLLPLILAIYLRINWHRTALYEDGTYVHNVAGLEFMRLTKEPEFFELQHCAVEGVRAEVFTAIMKTLEVVTGSDQAADMLTVVRPLVRFVAQLPDFSRRTMAVPATAVTVRKVLLEAREPTTLLFRDLPQACGIEPFGVSAKRSTADTARASDFADKLKIAVDDLRIAYDRLVQRLESSIVEAFAGGLSLVSLREQLQQRAGKLSAQIAEPGLKAFVLRLADASLPRVQWIESLGSLLVRKPPERWLDQDEVEFGHQLLQHVSRMARVEAIRFKADGGSAEACHLVMTRPDGTAVEHVFRWDDQGGNTALERELGEIMARHGKRGLAMAARLVWKSLETS